jgi:hypothetical protein
VPKVDVVLVSAAEALDPANRYGWGFWFQHCCAWVAGADIIPAIRPFRPSWALSLGLNGDIQAYLERVQLQLGAASSPERRPIVVRAFARKLVRTAFGSVSVLEQSWTDDLAVAAQAVRAATTPSILRRSGKSSCRAGSRRRWLAAGSKRCLSLAVARGSLW